MTLRDCRSGMTMRLLALLAIGLSACAVNPVPTPATGGNVDSNLATGGADAQGEQADIKSTVDASFAADSSDASTTTVELVTVLAQLTDPAIDVASAGGVHAVAVAPNTLATGKLVVLLPDATLLATDYFSIASAIAQQGHRVIVLATPVAALTACGGDATCLELARQEFADGQDRTPKVSVNTANSLQNRLIKALTWLDKDRPGENWGKFYNGSTPYWAAIAIAGHGEGASEAAMLAKKNIVWRVALLGGPTDGANAQPAAWLSGTAATAATAWRAFGHAQDPAAALIGASWTALGLGSSAAVQSVDGAQQPGASAQLLTTAMDVPDPHAAIAVDAALPKDSTAAQHLHVAWKLLFWPF